MFKKSIRLLKWFTMRFRLFFFVILFVASSFYVEGMSKPQKEPFLGVKTLYYEDSIRNNRPILVEVWYPTFDPRSHSQKTPGVWIHPEELRDATLDTEGKKLPLILMSHGHRGDRRERSWLADSLVKAGYIVVSVDHDGDTRDTFHLLRSLCFWERPLDVSYTLDRLVQETWLHESINWEQIGFIGYSLGGMTGLALAGAEGSQVKEKAQALIASRKELSWETVNQLDFTQGEKNYKEPRIRAMVLICPAVFIYSPSTLKNIEIPIGLIAAIEDEVLPHQEHANKMIRHGIASKLKVMQSEISHYSFLNLISKQGKKLFTSSDYQKFLACDNATVHQETSTFTLRFFKTVFSSHSK